MFLSIAPTILASCLHLVTILKWLYMCLATSRFVHTNNSLIRLAMSNFHPLVLKRNVVQRHVALKGYLSYLTLLFFPSSFLFDFMHLIWENLLLNLILLWTSKFKGLDEGCESYQLGPSIWEAIREATKVSGSTIPSAFATACPQNVAKDPLACTADSWSFLALYLGPVLLRGHFQKEIYYKHFVKLIKLLCLCLQFEMTKKELAKV